MDIGFHAAGFETAVAVEQDSSCCATLRKNFKNVPVLEGDINHITTQQILEVAQLTPLEAALVIGGPPCQSFSLAGKRMGLDDPRGKLVLEYLRVVQEALPVAFVMENVKGMVNWAQGQALNAILTEAAREISYQGTKYQYQVSFQVLNAVDFGAPQFRERVFIVGNRLNKTFKFPQPTHVAPSTAQADLFGEGIQQWVSAWDAIGDLPAAEEPSETAMRVSATIKDRIIKHGY